MAPTDWYETHKKNVAAALKKAKTVAKSEAVLCALVKNKDNSHVLCAGVAKPKMVMDAKKAGGKVVSDGIVFSDDGKPTFEVSEGDVSVGTKFAAAAAEVLGSPMKVEVVKASGAPPAPPPPSPPRGAAPGAASAFAAPAGNVPPPPPPPPRGSAPSAPPAPGAPAENVPPPPPGAPPAKPQAPAPAPGTEEAKFNDRLKQLLPAVIEAQKAKSGNAGELKLAASEAQTFGRKKDFAQANALLDKVQALLQTPPASAAPAENVPPPPPPPPPRGAVPGAAPASSATAGNVPPPPPGRETAPNPPPAPGAPTGNVPPPPGGAAPNPPPAPSAAGTTGKASPAGKKVSFDERDFRKVWSVVKQTWLTASDKVDAQLTELIKAMKADDDPEMKKIADKGLNAVTGNFKVPLLAAVREVDGATGEALQKAVPKARRILTDFRNHINSDKRVAACDDNPWDVPVTIRAEIGGALDKMDKALEAVTK